MCTCSYTDQGALLTDVADDVNVVLREHLSLVFDGRAQFVAEEFLHLKMETHHMTSAAHAAYEEGWVRL